MRMKLRTLTGPNKMRLLLRFAATIAVLRLLCLATASAHDLPVSEMRIVAAEEAMHMEIVLNSAKLNFFSEIDRDKNGFLDPEELKKQSDQISELIVDCLVFQIHGKLVTAAMVGVVPNVGSHHLTVRAHYPVDAREAPVHLKSSLRAIMRNSHVLEVTFQRPDQCYFARLDARDQGVLFDYEKENTLLEQPTALPDSDNSPRDYYLFIGLAALVGSFILFRSKHR
jgi:hypothetical protein